jgi:hypothetical protein
VILPGITSSWKLIQAGKIKILKAVTISGSASLNPIYCEGQLFKKFKCENVIKMKNKPDPALVGGSFLFNEIKKRTPKSRETNPIKKSRKKTQHIKSFVSRYSKKFRNPQKINANFQLFLSIFVIAYQERYLQNTKILDFLRRQCAELIFFAQMNWCQTRVRMSR